MKLPGNKIRWRVGAASLALGLVVALLVALPAYAAVGITFLPTSGAPGTPVAITGTGGSMFLSGGVTVKFNGTSAVFTVVNDTSINTSVPCGATSGNIVVTDTTDGTITGASFTVNAASAPTVTGFNPTFGTAGSTVVVITGTNFCGASAVRFNNTTASVVSINSPTQITATVPSGATTGKISVQTALGTGTSAANFIVGPPVISSFTPTIAPAGSAVTISGSNFTGVTSVKFNGVSASFTVNTDLQISTTVPVGATSGPITVTNPVGTATSVAFTVGVPSHDRTVSFGFQPNSRVSGQVNVADNFSACNSFVPVVIQKQKKGSGWKWVDTTSTTKSGSFKTYIPPSKGTFRAKINKLTLMNGATCLGDASPTKHHNG